MKYIEPEMEVVEFEKGEIFTLTTSSDSTEDNTDIIIGGWDN